MQEDVSRMIKVSLLRPVSRFVSQVVVAASLAVVPVAFSSSATAADLKVLVVNHSAVIQGSLAGKDQAKKLRAIFKAIETDARTAMEPLAVEAKTLQGQQALLGDGYVRKQAELQSKAEFVKYQFEQERKFTQDAAQQLIVKEIFPIYNEIMQELKGTLLLDQSQVIMTSPDYNITEDVIKRLDDKMKTVDVKRVTFAEIQEAFKEQQARFKAVQEARN